MLMSYRTDPMSGFPQAAHAALLTQEAVARVALPGEAPAMAVLGHKALKEFIGRPDVTKGAEHFTALREARIPDRTLAGRGGVVDLRAEEGTAGRSRCRSQRRSRRRSRPRSRPGYHRQHLRRRRFGRWCGGVSWTTV
ncbi:hypothetical protein [Streptomyces sp. NPDC059479]|uniref:hypothetical protein n=1 Tax=Streptomyces sp. NPDC059479 TaxID=3346848 RepID=UPI0036B979DB